MVEHIIKKKDMKKLVLALVALVTMTVSASAMSYEQAREQALFLTDKMAYELNLTDEQYEAAYEVNLDYLMTVVSPNDVYGIYWRQRNLDLSYILLDWQYRMFVDATYFYRPLYWDAGYWHFGIYARYPYRDYFFFGRPRFYAVYHGGHSWRMNGGRSWYHGRKFVPRDRRRGSFSGMRDGFENGRYGRGTREAAGGQTFGNGKRSNNASFANGSRPASGVRTDGTRVVGGSRSEGTRVIGGSRSEGTRVMMGGSRSGQKGSPVRGMESSTRTTVTRPGTMQPNTTTSPSRSFTPSRSTTTSPSRSFTPSRNTTTSPSRSFSPSRSATTSPSRNTSSGSSRSTTTSPSRSFGGRR